MSYSTEGVPSVSAIMTDSDMTLLAGLKGRTLKSLEYEPIVGKSACDGLLRVNTGGHSLAVTCLWEAASVFGEPEEEVAVFHCVASDPAEPLYRMPGNSDIAALAGDSTRVPGTLLHELDLMRHPHKTRRYLVGERITGVEVVRERFDDLECGECFEMDVTIALRTKHGVVSFSRGRWFDETIDVGLGLPVDVDVAAISPREKTWPHLTAEDLETCEFVRATIKL